MPSPLPAERIALKERRLEVWLHVFLPRATQRVALGHPAIFRARRARAPAREPGARNKLAARIAVDSDGIAALKGLVIDGKPEYQEPLFSTWRGAPAVL